MSVVTTDLPPPVNHVFVDFENVHEIDLAIIGSKNVSFTLLLGARQTKLDVALVEKLLEYAASVQLVRLNSAGRNALDFTLAYYVGRLVAADPSGRFHIVSKDAGFDPLIEHLRSKHICARRHHDFATLTFSGAAKPPTAAASSAAPKPKHPSAPQAKPATLDEWETQVLEHFRKHPTGRPASEKKLLSYLVAHRGRQFTEADALELVKRLSKASHLVIGEKGAVAYHLEPKPRN
jgi:hypothetical protein